MSGRALAGLEFSRFCRTPVYRSAPPRPALVNGGAESYRTAVSGQSLDLSGWSRRDEAAREAAQALLARVANAESELRAICARFGVGEAHLFGSLARGDARPGSDVDMAVSRCPPEAFYRLAAELERTLGLPLDLVDLDSAPAEFAAEVRRSGRRIHPPPSGNGSDK